MSPPRARFIVPGEPVAKGRPRFALVGGQVRVYTPARTRNFERLVSSSWHSSVSSSSWPVQGPVGVVVESRFGSLKPDRKRTPRLAAWKDVGEDTDNLAKAVLDGLNGLAYEDDKQVVWLLSKKLRQPQGREPCTVVTVEGLTELDLEIRVADLVPDPQRE